MLFICPFCYYISNRIIFNDKVIKKFSLLFIILIIIFNVRNLDRIQKELSLKENEHHNFKSFPFYWVNKPYYKKSKNKLIDLNHVDKRCWATPSVCINISEDELEIKKNKNFIIISRKMKNVLVSVIITYFKKKRLFGKNS